MTEALQLKKKKKKIFLVFTALLLQRIPAHTQQ